MGFVCFCTEKNDIFFINFFVRKSQFTKNVRLPDYYADPFYSVPQAGVAAGKVTPLISIYIVHPSLKVCTKHKNFGSMYENFEIASLVGNKDRSIIRI